MPDNNLDTNIQALSGKFDTLDKEKNRKNYITELALMVNKDPNYKMLALLFLILLNFSIFVEVANWLKHSSLSS